MDTPPFAERVPAWLRRVGDVWLFRYAGVTITVRASKGIDDLARLLAEPGRDVPCLELAGSTVIDRGAGPVIDPSARRAYEARLGELRAADDNGAEREALAGHLARALGRRGAVRSHRSDAERARSAVTQRIRSAIVRIGDAHPALGRHLAAAVRTGACCSYRPPADTVWRVEG